MSSASPETRSHDPADEISREEILARLGDSSLRVVDVLPRSSYGDTHIAGALSLPLHEVESRAASVLPDRAADIAVYCGGPT
ncbi:MAG TPA: rhodanese-like domain-containing protein [Candidatus Udaeobacter sp.]|nr:rhodanese-like domain-containing protein [Candidatus Udaeobacter sp.]